MLLHNHHHAKTIKGLIPASIPLEHGKGARHRSMCLGQLAHDTPPYIASSYSNSGSIALADVAAGKTYTVAAEKDGGDVLRVAVQSGFVVLEQLSSLVLCELASNRKVVFRYATPFWWFFEEHHLVVICHNELTRIALSDRFQIGTHVNPNPPSSHAARPQ